MPDIPGVQLNDVFTRFLNGSGGIDHVVNTTGAAVTAASPGPASRHLIPDGSDHTIAQAPPGCGGACRQWAIWSARCGSFQPGLTKWQV